MHFTVQNLNNIKNEIKLKLNSFDNKISPKIIAVSKTFSMDKIKPLIESGHIDFGENKVQEAIDKWSQTKLHKNDIKLHLIGKLQTNKVKLAIKIFDYLHSIDNEKLAKKVADELKKNTKKVGIFIQVNIGREEQKSGITVDKLYDFYNYCTDLKLDVIGLMCIPPIKEDPVNYFIEMQSLNKKLKLNQLSMGMSADYLKATEYSSTFLRIGSSIFGKRI